MKNFKINTPKVKSSSGNQNQDIKRKTTMATKRADVKEYANAISYLVKSEENEITLMINSLSK